MKYRIPERWTKKFDKFDIIDVNIYSQKPGINQERGRINKEQTVEAAQKEKQLAKLAIQSFQNDPTQPMSNTILKNVNQTTDKKV